MIVCRNKTASIIHGCHIVDDIEQFFPGHRCGRVTWAMMMLTMVQPISGINLCPGSPFSDLALVFTVPRKLNMEPPSLLLFHALMTQVTSSVSGNLPLSIRFFTNLSRRENTGSPLSSPAPENRSSKNVSASRGDFLLNS